MDESGTGGRDGIILDVLGQHPLPIYTQICFCFPVDDASTYPQLIKTLEAGLARICAAFPWLGGHVANEGATIGNTGVFKIKDLGGPGHFSVKDIRDDPSIPSYADLRLARFTINALEEGIFAPRKTRIDEYHSSPPDVLLVQATLISGGLVLTFLGQHQAMDGIGQDHIIRLFSKTCRNEGFTTEELHNCNLSKANDIPLLEDPCDLKSKLRHQIIDPQSSKPSSQPQECSWAYFSFSKVSLETLKTMASQDSSSRFISTDDALSAFIWKSVTRARLARFSAATPSTFVRAVDVRKSLGISSMHPGFAQNMAYSTLTFEELAEMSLVSVAARLRSRIDGVAYDTRVLGTFIAQTEDKSCISFAATLDFTSGIFFASWAKMKAYGYDFGRGLGKAEAVRRTRSHITEGLMYLMPKALDGEIGLVVCLNDRDMGMLRKDEGFLRFATYVG